MTAIRETGTPSPGFPAETPNPIPVPVLIAQIHELEYQSSWLNDFPQDKERSEAKKSLAHQKALRVFLLLGERDNPAYNMSVTLRRLDEAEIHPRAAHRFTIEVDDNEGNYVGKVTANLAMLAIIPYFNGNSEKVLYELVKPDALEKEGPASFSERIHDEIRQIEEDYGIAVRSGQLETAENLSHQREVLIERIIRLRLSWPELRYFIFAKLRKGREEVLINLNFERHDSKAFNNYVTFPWSKEADLLILASGGYTFIDESLIPEDEE